METIIRSKRVKRRHVREALVTSGLMTKPPKLDDYRHNESLGIYSFTLEADDILGQIKLRQGADALRRELRVTEVVIPNFYMRDSYPVRVVIMP